MTEKGKTKETANLSESEKINCQSARKEHIKFLFVDVLIKYFGNQGLQTKPISLRIRPIT